MKIHLTVEADREEGKTMSGELVGEALVSQLEGESVEVEDSVYSITSAEATPPPSKGKGGDGIDLDNLLLALDELMNAYRKVRPLALWMGEGEKPEEREPDAIDKAMEPFLFSPGLGGVILRAKIRRAKQDDADKRKVRIR